MGSNMEELLEDIRALGSSGNPEACEILFESFQDEMMWYAFRFLGNEADAEDAAQCALSKIWDQICNGIKQLRKAYLLRAVHFECLHILRDRRRRKTYENQGEMAGWTEVPITVVSQIDSGEWRELQTALELAVEKLPEKLRVVVQLIFMDGYSLEEIAKMLGITPSAVGKRRNKALGKLKCAILEQSHRN